MAPSEHRVRDIKRVLAVILVLNLLVAGAKGLVGWATGSLSVTADALHSTLDGASNIVGLIAITLAAADPDREHPYGHRKFEVLGALGIGVLLAGASWNILTEAWSRWRSPQSIDSDWTSFAVMGATMVVNIGVAVYERRRGTALDSEVLLADSAHTRSDVLATAGVIASLVAARYDLRVIDILVAVAIAGLIAWAAVRVALSGARVLADRAVLDPAGIKRVALAVDGVVECHEVRTRGTRDAIFCDLRIHLPPDLSLVRAHEIGHNVERRLKEAYPGLNDVVVHVEPHEHEPGM
jgi:cation diffusion facilitator family transporter